MVNFATDHVFHIGCQHLRSGKPCQDYALSGTLQGAAYATVSDGCSSGNRTDIGARLLCLASAQGMAGQWLQNRQVAMHAAVNLQQHMLLATAQNLLDLTVEDQLATSLYAFAAEGQGAFAHLRGDGVIAALSNAGVLTLVRVEWANNMPYYPAYTGNGLAGFIRHHGGNLEGAAATWQQWQGTGANSLRQVASGTLSLRQGIEGYTWAFTAEGLAELRYLAVFTDGVTQVDNLPWQQAAHALLAFKSTSGDFAKRRMNRFLRDVESLGKGPLDDLGYAVIQLTPTEQEG